MNVQCRTIFYYHRNGIANRTFKGPEDYVRSRGVNVEVLDNAECVALMEDFIAAEPALWDEGMGE